jgi:hypothetical protein
MAELTTNADVQASGQRLQLAIDNLSLPLTVRLGFTLVASIDTLAALIKLGGFAELSECLGPKAIRDLAKRLMLLVPQEGFEPPTPSLRMMCSTS